jgi:hypothetical protein
MLSVAITIVASLVTIFVTKPTANEKLVSFAEKVRPMGAWNGLVKGEDRNKDLFLSIAIWVFAVIMSYSLLFVIADVLFQNWDVILPKALILLASFAAFAWLSKIYNQKYLAKE